MDRKLSKYFLIISLLIISLIYSYIHISTKEVEKLENPNISEFISHKLFFIENNDDGKNLLSYDLDNQQTEKISGYEPNYFTQIDEKHLGLLVYEDFTYSIRIIDLETKEEQMLVEYSHPNTIEIVDFYSPTKFAFSVLATKTDTFEDSYYQFFLYHDGEIKKLTQEKITHMGGGGVGLIFQSTIKKVVNFSPDGNKFFYASPLSYFAPEPAFYDYRVYVFDLINDSHEIIEEAQSPFWLNNEKMIYSKIVRKIENNNTYELTKGFHIYDTTTNTTKKLSSVDDNASLPKVSYTNWKILYSLLDGEDGIWIYNLSTGINEQILPYGWNAEWITPNFFLFRILKNKDDPFDVFNEVIEVKLFDIENGKEIELPKDVQEWFKY